MNWYYTPFMASPIRRLAVIMDSIEHIHPDKDTTLGLMEAAARRDWQLHYFTQAQLYLHNGRAWGMGKDISVFLDSNRWFEFDSEAYPIALDDCSAVLFRTDPPVDLDYLYACHILDFAQSHETLVVNNPASIRLANEKIFAQKFADLCPPTLLTQNNQQITEFIDEHKSVVVKSLNQMGGKGISRLEYSDFPNPKDLQNQIDQITDHESQMVMLQRLIPDYAQGDKRVLLINGEPVPYALLRIPPPNQLCANLAAGGRGEGVTLNDRDRIICNRIGETLKSMGLLFVGIDIVGGYLTEINITSPTCMRELNHIYDLDIGNDVISAIEAQLDR